MNMEILVIQFVYVEIKSDSPMPNLQLNKQ